MRYGTLPVVRDVGGLSDTIVNATEWAVRNGSATGFAFREPSVAAMLDCLDRALAFHAQPIRWRKMQQRAMSREFGWDASARRYLAVYRSLAPHVAQAETGRHAASSCALVQPALEAPRRERTKPNASTSCNQCPSEAVSVA
jgi:starch synthase